MCSTSVLEFWGFGSIFFGQCAFFRVNEQFSLIIPGLGSRSVEGPAVSNFGSHGHEFESRMGIVAF